MSHLPRTRRQLGDEDNEGQEEDRNYRSALPSTVSAGWPIFHPVRASQASSRYLHAF
ncbi:hypothetical protein [Paraburkholderia diazotrophica]|uniref:hypothetical protein n=1 Tax=Paraburkholderia diazotrophica TaxID=667676 RepID=UPI0015A563BE|nr:hypothetical protein [Paraburkholderia diazotrophica]